MIVRLPGVYPPQHDTSLLSDALLFEPLTADSRVLDLCCGTGALSVASRRAGAGHVVAVDISRRAQVNTWLNAVINRKRVDARRGDLTDAVGSELFDLIISNPPYVPAWDDALPTAGIARAWDAGKDGRSVLDRIAARAPDHVAPGGTLLLLQSALCGVDKTAAILEEFGMLVEVSARASVPFGPVMTGRRMMLESRGLITADQDTEQLVIIRATK
ncbi:UNVERIFIED_ORG: release factor glutamine methyltransferase [Nocardia globerula]|uniref:Release factor glutamine methyltransferase n=1 Tax=Nocardia globerula TaxID=1818 RepID=A0A652YVG2_NOCGL|nr:HemK2/MTQ2 family protein methyltransferase [Rhodococcus globerulus]NMD59910.1 methyltransferase [Nocardia globerula]PVX63979.1 release factor glutamine methyltransferase [Rhodococcus globerulus]